ncbi:serine/threonine protein kinase [Nanoarchaeota archaeon]
MNLKEQRAKLLVKADQIRRARMRWLEEISQIGSMYATPDITPANHRSPQERAPLTQREARKLYQERDLESLLFQRAPAPTKYGLVVFRLYDEEQRIHPGERRYHELDKSDRKLRKYRYLKSTIKKDPDKAIAMIERGLRDNNELIGALAAQSLEALVWKRPDESIELYRMAMQSRKGLVCICAARALGALAWVRPREYSRLKGEAGGNPFWEATLEAILSAEDLVNSSYDPELVPVMDETLEFMKKYLASSYVHENSDPDLDLLNEGKILENMTEILHSTGFTYERLTYVLEARTAKDTQELLVQAKVKFDNYHLSERIPEQGYTSEIYFAHNTDERRSPMWCMIKIMPAKKHPKIQEHEEKGGSTTEEMFRNDIVNLTSLAHPNIALCLDHGIYQDPLFGERIYIVEEHYAGGSLETNLNRINPWRVGAAFLTGLTYIHRQGLVHRDIKPKNIFITFSDVAAVVGDLQNCVPMDQPEKMAGISHGRTHAAPETLMRDYADQRSDVYSAGVVLWRMWTGRSYDLRSPESIRKLGPKRAREYYCNLTKKMLAQMPPGRYEATEIIGKCMQYNPDDRFQNATEVKKAFFDLIEQREKYQKEIRERFDLR